jgi:hypothetical protein
VIAGRSKGHHCAQTGSEAHTSSSVMGTVSSFSRALYSIDCEGEVLCQGWPTTRATAATYEFTLWPRATDNISYNSTNMFSFIIMYNEELKGITYETRFYLSENAYLFNTGLFKKKYAL